MSETNNIPQVAITSHQGSRGDENDDHAAWFAVARPDRHWLVHVGVVADGVTSTKGGAQASRIATEAIEASLRDLPDAQETISEWLATAIGHAHEEIRYEGKRNPEWQGMSTTVVVAALAGNRLYVLHLGDSRAYLIRAGQLHQLTTDHTWAQAAVAAGTLTASEAAHHPGRNQLQRYLGGSKQINVARGVLAPGSGHPEEYLLVQPGDQVLLCSDGIYHRLEPATMAAIINKAPAEPKTVVDDLITAAIAQGEIDDITALLFTVPAQQNSYAADQFRPHVATDSDATVPVGNQPLVQPPSATRWTLREVGLIIAVVIFIVVAIYLLGY